MCIIEIPVQKKYKKWKHLFLRVAAVLPPLVPGVGASKPAD